ncbi:LADA_0D07426g1_1 [Lachancea dasiensis]|uniref:LADA_0D07426g1_1 n=1 Tax=Lachancea dasiensis TaxID=1072105 RepID=A0A1G4J6G9_9SACH|nr:LADA_0D07426g1_1 [Lachancea dasiensis]
MASVDYRATTEDPDLLFQFSSPVTRPTGASVPDTHRRAEWRNTPGFETELLVHSDLSMQHRAASVHMPSSSVGDSSTLNDNNSALMDDDTQTLYGQSAATSAAPSLRSWRPAQNETRRSSAAVGSSAQPLRTTPRLTNVQELSRFNNILNKSLSTQRMQDIEKMVDDFWLRDSKLTEDMFEDSSDEEA